MYIVGFRYWQSDLQLMFTKKDTQKNFNVLYLDEKLILNIIFVQQTYKPYTLAGPTDTRLV